MFVLEVCEMTCLWRRDEIAYQIVRIINLSCRILLEFMRSCLLI